MKFENMVIRCDSEYLARTVIKNLVKTGYKDTSIDNWKNVICYDFGVCSTYPMYNTALPKFQIKTFKEFMCMGDNTMIKKIHQAKKELGLNNSELSLRMGKSRPYIAKMLNQPQSEKVQKKVIKQLDDILDTENYLKPYAEQAKKMQEDAKIVVCNSDNFKKSHAKDTIDNDPRGKEIADLKKIIESKDLAISGLIKQNDEAKKIHDQDEKTIKFQEKKYLDLVKTNEQSNRERDYFVNQYKQSEEDVSSLKSKIKRERIIILIVIVILTALFFLKGSIGG